MNYLRTKLTFYGGGGDHTHDTGRKVEEADIFLGLDVGHDVLIEELAEGTVPMTQEGKSRRAILFLDWM
jgi:hypothetical protein